MAPHWKCGSRQRVGGSNPPLSATRSPRASGQARVVGSAPLAHARPSALARVLAFALTSGKCRRLPRPAGYTQPCRARRGTSGALNLQSAPAGLNSSSRSPCSEAAAPGDVEDRVPRSGESRTVSGPEGSSTQRSSSGAAERPGPSRLRWWARVSVDRQGVHGIFIRRSPASEERHDEERFGRGR